MQLKYYSENVRKGVDDQICDDSGREYYRITLLCLDWFVSWPLVELEEEFFNLNERFRTSSILEPSLESDLTQSGSINEPLNQ